jgi:fibronectin type 3 domain-containing protein
MSYPVISPIWNTYTHPLLNYTVTEQYSRQGTKNTIKIENPPNFELDDLSVFTDAKIIQHDQYITVFEVYDTERNSFLVRNLEELLLTKPNAPASLSARPGEDDISLSWDSELPDPSFPVKEYRIYRGTRPGEENLLVEIGDTTYYKDTSVKNGNTYYYRVSAVNAVGEGPQSQEVKATSRQIIDQEEPGNQLDKESVRTRLFLMLVWALVMAVFLIGAVLIFVDHVQTRR